MRGWAKDGRIPRFTSHHVEYSVAFLFEFEEATHLVYKLLKRSTRWEVLRPTNVIPDVLAASAAASRSASSPITTDDMKTRITGVCL
jgi:hypothetical protein